ncbi:DUF2141 domain-containing protein [Govanella unica]|uniref:DUF2141 domain-containing protein n=1 Tax=Govanella unica TaxID=2975056 RepID=A0A9X3Z7P0_9PROT|nr:DUF2141 domain-containing protein [Govania unica]MDA5194194.1 DUF2141 domain-containing protein [Govania unica]
MTERIVGKILGLFLLLGAATPLLAGEVILGPHPEICKAGSTVPALLVHVEGFKDRKGQVRLELYSDQADDFLADRDDLLARHAVFVRIDVPTPAEGPVAICLQPPGAGQYSLMVLHDRDYNKKFTLFTDGVGFSNNPRLGLSKPSVKDVIFSVGGGVKDLTVVLNYMHGLTPRPVSRPK